MYIYVCIRIVIGWGGDPVQGFVMRNLCQSKAETLPGVAVDVLVRFGLRSAHLHFVLLASIKRLQAGCSSSASVRPAPLAFHVETLHGAAHNGA